jgi:hypothetical protein
MFASMTEFVCFPFSWGFWGLKVKVVNSQCVCAFVWYSGCVVNACVRCLLAQSGTPAEHSAATCHRSHNHVISFFRLFPQLQLMWIFDVARLLLCLWFCSCCLFTVSVLVFYMLHPFCFVVVVVVVAVVVAVVSLESGIPSPLLLALLSLSLDLLFGQRTCMCVLMNRSYPFLSFFSLSLSTGGVWCSWLERARRRESAGSHWSMRVRSQVLSAPLV